jgi:hypothetical protein
MGRIGMTIDKNIGSIPKYSFPLLLVLSPLNTLNYSSTQSISVLGTELQLGRLRITESRRRAIHSESLLVVCNTIMDTIGYPCSGLESSCII